ncbi:MAG: hypothetical protein ACE5JM_12570, partial [Armatimonadota bacterium]
MITGGTPPPVPGSIEGLLGPGSPLPRRWTLVNPLADPAAPSPWAAILDPGAVDRLSEYDVVLLSAVSLAELAAQPNALALQEALKAICDAGVVVWMDGAGAPGFELVNSPFVSFTTLPPGGGPNAIDLTHPLGTIPFPLITAEVGALCPAGQVATSASSNVLHAVAGGPIATPTIAAGEYGSGAVVVSASDIFSQLIALSLPAQKFACNVLAWSQRWNTESGVPRHLARTNFTTLAPLRIAWQFPSPLITPAVFGIAPIRTSPVVDRGIAFVATSPPPGDLGTLYAFDVNPARDINRDGFADDGAPGFPPDYSVGSPHDVLWEAALPGTPLYAAPCGALRNLRDPAGAVTGLEHVVLVSTLAPPDAAVTCLRVADATVAWTATAPRSNPVVWISSPVVHRGYVYFLTQEDDGAGVQYTRVHAIDLDTGGATSIWVYPDPVGGGDPNVDEPDTLIPPVTDPALPGPAPCISSTARRADGELLDAVVYFGTTVSFVSETDTTTPQVIQPVAPTSGGTEFAVVPTPPRDVDGDGVDDVPWIPPNLGYSRVAVSNVGAGAATAALQDDETTDALAPGPPWTPPTPVPDGLVFDPRWVRMYMVNEATLPAGSSTSDVIGWQEGRNVIVEYPMGGTTTSEALLLRGPVLWKRRFGAGTVPEPRIASTTVSGETALLSTVSAPAAGPALLHGLAAETEAPLLGFMPGFLGVDWTGSAAAGESTAYMLQSSSVAA